MRGRHAAGLQARASVRGLSVSTAGLRGATRQPCADKILYQTIFTNITCIQIQTLILGNYDSLCTAYKSNLTHCSDNI